jgi:glutamate dehydrogenase/leucine dehydrogenase
MRDFQVSGPIRIARYPDVEIWEGRSPSTEAYSCVGLCRRSWDPTWPALGGTRWIAEPSLPFPKARELAHSEVARLSEAMMTKNRLLLRAERELQESDPAWKHRRTSFGWQGGKGVVLTTNQKDGLSPARLLCHGLLVESLKGAYFASEDQGVGKGELRWIARATRFNVGLSCDADTGDATAVGVLAAIYDGALLRGILDGTALERAEVLSAECPPILEGLNVLVLGAGKVGLPLLGLLAKRGARCFVFDPGLNVLGIQGFFRQNAERGAAIGKEHASLLEEIKRDRRILPDEESALGLHDVHVVSPNGGRTDWLGHEVVKGCSTAAFLARRKKDRRGALQLIAGAGNAQLIDDPSICGDAEKVLTPLAKQGIQWIPDPAVSPGGVIAVSHEQKDAWVLENVRADAYDVVRHNVAKLYEGASKLGGTDALGLYRAFQVRAQAEGV